MLALASVAAISLVTPESLLSLVKGELRPNSFLLKSPSAAARIDEACKALEAEGATPSFPRDLMSLDGEWRLVYSSALSPPLPEFLMDVAAGAPVVPRRVEQRIDVTKRRCVNVVTVTPWPSLPAPPLLDGLQEAEVTLELDHEFSVEGEGGSAGGRRQAAAGSVVDLRLDTVRRTLRRVDPAQENEVADEGEEVWVDRMNPFVRAEERKRAESEEAAGGAGFGSPLLDLIPRKTTYDLPFPLGALGAGSFDTPFVSGNVRISRGAGGVSPTLVGAPAELRVFERIGGDGVGVFRTWQEEEDALAAAAASAPVADRWQEGGLEEAEAMDFSGDYDVECPDA